MNPNMMLGYVQAGVAIVGGIASVIAGVGTIASLNNQQAQIAAQSAQDQND